MPHNARFFLVATVLLCASGAAPAAAQTPPGAPRNVPARSQTLFRHTLGPQSPPALPANADAVAFDRGNRLHVLDRQNRFIYVFRTDGALDRRLDLRGVADSPLQMTVTRDDRIVVSDVVRKVLISIDPRDPRRATEHAVGAMALSGPLAPHPDGGVVTQARPVSEADLATGRIPPARVVWFPLDGRAPVVLHTFASTSGGRGPRNPLTPGPLVAPLSGGGAVVALPDGYRLQVLRDGRTREIVRTASARAVGDHDRRWARQQAACEQVFMVGPSGRTQVNLAGAAPPIPPLPDRMPVLRALGVAPDGRIWVERTPSDPDRAGSVDVLSADGRLLGSVEGIGVPRAWAPDGQTAAYVTRDAGCRDTVEVRRVSVG
jgi:hypothetical protein